MAARTRLDSPDPLTLPSSPLSAHPYTRRAGSLKPGVRSTTPRASASPSKSLIMDTGAAQENSPWRIRVTVSAEPREGSGSPRKRVRTTRVPVREDQTDEESKGIRRLQRKRKGTPIARRTRSQKQLEPTTDEDDMDVAATTSPVPDTTSREDISVSSPTQQRIPTSEITRRTRMQPMRTERYKRLSAAREELDLALRNAVGSETSDRGDTPPSSDSAESAYRSGGLGELTVANEDFTMISGESLASIKANTSVLEKSHLEKSQLSVSHLPSSPPKGSRADDDTAVEYPNLTEAAAEAKTPGADRDAEVTVGQGYDAMSWKPTGPTTNYAQPPSDASSRQHADVHKQSHEGEQQYHDDEEEGEEDAVMGAEDPAAAEEDDDIWAEEASRSLEDSRVEQQSMRVAAQATSNAPPPIFSDDPIPPRRSKIPRTWRRESGVDFLYSDSPAHSQAEPKDADPQRTKAERSGGEGETDAESRRSSGVLTPPSTDEDESSRQHRRSVDQNIEEDEASKEVEVSGFTEVGAADTQLEAHHYRRQEVTSPLSDSSSSVTSPDEDDTGFFWQTNMPSLYQRPARRPPLKTQKQKQHDLSAVLRMDSSKVDAASPLVEKTVDPVTNSGTPSKLPASIGHNKTSNQRKAEFSPLLRPSNPLNPNPFFSSARRDAQKLVPSPLRKSLVRSSKSLDSSGDVSERAAQYKQGTQSTHAKLLNNRLDEVTHVSETVLDDSLASKESDQRQLLQDFARATPQPKRDARGAGLTGAWQKPSQQRQLHHVHDESLDVTNVTTDISKSYEENLNIESPQRIKVKFGDSTLSQLHTQTEEHNTSRLAPRRKYPPLFDKDANVPVLRPTLDTQGKQADNRSPPSVTLVNKRRTQQHQQQENEGIFARLSSSFWSAVVHPYASNLGSRNQASGPATPPRPKAMLSLTSPVKASLPLSTRAQLRNRYGVVSSTHPWTMTHIRTLHRLLNSLASGRKDTIVPTRLPLPPHLAELVGTYQPATTEVEFAFEHQHACVVNAFMHLLVAPELIAQMESGEVEWLGDKQAEHFRQVMGGRRGKDFCFQSEAVREISPADGENIDWQWVVGALGCCVLANLAIEEKKNEMLSKDGIVGGKGAEMAERVVQGSLMGDSDLMGDERIGRWFQGGPSRDDQDAVVGKPAAWEDIAKERKKIWPTLT